MYAEKPADMLSAVLEHARGLDLNAKNNSGAAPLQTAIGKGDVDLVRLLLDSQHRIDLDHLGWGTAIDAAVIKDSPEMLRLILVDERPYDVNALGGDGLPVLHRLVLQRELQLLRVLVEHGRGLDLLTRGNGLLASDLTTDEAVLALLVKAAEKR